MFIRAFSRIVSALRSGKTIIISLVIFSLLPLSIFTYAGPATTVPEINIVKNFDGTAPFDTSAGNGKDTGAQNNIVRAGDVTSYTFDMNLNDPQAASPTPYQNYTVSLNPLPLGFRYESLPLVCIGAGSQITGDGYTTPSQMTCNLGTKNTGDAFAMNVNVFTLPTVLNNESHSLEAVVSVDGVSQSGIAVTDPVIASIMPKIDLQKGAATYRGTYNVNGVPGGIWHYGLGIKLQKGSEVPAMPLTLTDDLSGIHPDARFMSCGLNDHNDPIGGYGYAVNMPVVTGGVHNTNQYPGAFINQSNAGTISCNTQAENEQTVDISINNIPPIVSSYPTTTFPYTTPVSPGDNWIGAYYVSIWIPYNAFTEQNNYSFSGTNKFNDFNPNGLVSGEPNYNDYSLEPGRGVDNVYTSAQTGLTGKENWYTQVFYRPTPGYFDKVDYKYQGNSIANATMHGDVSNVGIWNGYVGTNYRSGDGVMAANGSYTAMNVTRFTGIIDIPAGYTDCMTIDTNNVTVAALDGKPGRAAYIYGGGRPALVNQYAQPKIEYGIGGANGAGTGWATYTDQKNGTCRDQDSTNATWYTNINDVPGGPEAVTKVRTVLQDTFTTEEQLEIIGLTGGNVVYNYQAVRLKVKESAVPGSIAPNYGTQYDPSGQWFTGTNNGYRAVTYNYQNGTASLGDRITVVGTRVRIQKTVNSTSAETQTSLTGSENTWYLASTSDALGVNPAGTSNNVTITDTIPSGLNYVVGSGECTIATAVQPVSCEPEYTINQDGTSTLVWDFGTFTAGSAMTTIRYKTTSDYTLANNTTHINTATISADNDNSPVQWRTDTAAVVVINPSAFSVQKKVLTPLVEIGSPITYQLVAKNTGSNPVAGTDFIDWLPFNGDQRVPATQYHGSTQLTSLSYVSGVQASQIRYTMYDPSLLAIPADFDPATINSAIIWCTQAQFGTVNCPTGFTDVTGVRIQSGALNANEGFVYNMTITPDPLDINKNGDVYTNRFKGRVTGLSVPVESNNVPAYVYSGRIGDTVYYDRNGNGVQDEGEEGLSGIEVTLTNQNGDAIDCDNNTSGIQPCVTLTDENGKYEFSELFFGTYTVRITNTQGYYFSGEPDTELDGVTTVTLSNNSPSTRTNLFVDFGLTLPASIGNFIWEDANGNGIQDEGEMPLEGVGVQLLDEEGNPAVSIDGIPLGTRTTTAQGNYAFEFVRPGRYTVQFIAPDGMVFSPYTAGSDSTKDSNATPQTGMTSLIALEAEEFNDTIDAGLFTPVTIGDFVWVDDNHNGIQDNGEMGLNGMIVTLTDGNGNPVTDINGNTVNPQYTTNTNGDGSYRFTNLKPDTYLVRILSSDGYMPTVQLRGEDTSLDSDGDSNGYATAFITRSGDVILDIDFGMYQSATISDYVWNDVNKNGIQEEGDFGLAGVEVRLTDANGNTVIDTNGNTVEPMYTDENGLYSFINLYPQEYIVTFVRPYGYTISPAFQDTNTDFDSDGIITTTNRADTVSTGVITLGSGEIRDDIDQGFYISGAIGNYVWHDLNGDGYQDEGEPAMAQVELRLRNENGDLVTTDASGNPLTSVFSDSNGFYEFVNLPAGLYQIEVVTQSPQLLSPQSEGGETNSDADPITRTTSVFTLEDGQIRTDIDFGIMYPSYIGDQVWEDKNGNGIQDEGENGIAGVTVTLYSGGQNGAVVAQTQTDENGYYSFGRLVPGDYTIVVSTPQTMVLSPINQGGDASVDSNGDVIEITLLSGTTDLTFDTGLYTPARIGNFVWHDLNANGIQDEGEEGLAGVRVQLLNIDTEEIIVVYSDENGYYEFTNLAPAPYFVLFGAVDSFYPSPQFAGNEDTDSNGLITENILYIRSGDVISNIDAGYYQLASLGNFVWHDLNANGIQDEGENGIAGVTVTLTYTDGDGSYSRVAITDENGYYEFTDLNPLYTYSVSVTKPSGYHYSPTEVGDSNTDSNGLVFITLESGEHNNSIDFGFYQTTGFGDFVWEDKNGNGIQDEGENGIAGVTVTLRDSEGNEVLFDDQGNEITPLVTDETGFYEFTNLTPGSYQIAVTLPNGFVFTSPMSGENGRLDSDIDPTTGLSHTLTLSSNEYNAGLDVGAYIPVTIGNYVWYDTNVNGIQDEGETGVASIMVEIFNMDTNEFFNTMTDENGYYQFSDVTPGRYLLTISDDFNEYHLSPVQVGDDRAIDSSYGINEIISGQNDDTLDIGVYKYITIGDTVWEDSNANGIQDEGEEGLAGVTVTLTDLEGNPISNSPFSYVEPVTTDENGTYAFTDLEPGNYRVIFTTPAHMVPSPVESGEDIARDSNGISVNVDATRAIDISTIDSGFYRYVSIGDTVWEDKNGNGIQDEGENGIAGVTVTLLDENKEPVRGQNNTILTVITDENGSYTFADLVPGTYFVQFTTPQNMIPTRVITGNSNLNSDAGADGISQAITLLSGQSTQSIDAGYIRPASISGIAWIDTNNNGQQDTNEPFAPNSVVRLVDENGNPVTDASGNPVNPVIVGNDGAYTFVNLLPGVYKVLISPPSDYIITKQDLGSDDTDSDISASSFSSATITLQSSMALAHVDAGVYPEYTISIEDPYVCGSGFFGIVASGLNPTVTIQLYRVSDNSLAHTYYPLLQEDGTYEYALDYTNTSAFNYVTQGQFRVVFTATDVNGNSDSDEILASITNSCGTAQLVRTGSQIADRILVYVMVFLVAYAVKGLARHSKTL